MTHTVLQAKNIHKTFSIPHEMQILRDINFSIKEQESIAIMGASGEGKTTLLHILGTLETFDLGELEIAGQNTKKTPAHKIRNKHIGFIFQSYNLLEDFTALENVLMPLRIARKKLLSKSPLHLHAKKLLKDVGLEDRASYPVKLLSGGEKQRVAIARSLCNDPDLILADEPSGNLDHINSQIIHNLLMDCVSKKKKSLIVVTHDTELASLCDHIYVLKNGTLVLQST